MKGFDIPVEQYEAGEDAFDEAAFNMGASMRDAGYPLDASNPYALAQAAKRRSWRQGWCDRDQALLSESSNGGSGEAR